MTEGASPCIRCLISNERPSVLYHGEAKVERKVRYLSRLRLYTNTPPTIYTVKCELSSSPCHNVVGIHGFSAISSCAGVQIRSTFASVGVVKRCRYVLFDVVLVIVHLGDRVVYRRI